MIRSKRQRKRPGAIDTGAPSDGGDDANAARTGKQEQEEEEAYDPRQNDEEEDDEEEDSLSPAQTPVTPLTGRFAAGNVTPRTPRTPGTPRPGSPLRHSHRHTVVLAFRRRKQVEELKGRLDRRREGTTLFRSPLRTLRYFTLIVWELLQKVLWHCIRSKTIMFSFATVVLASLMVSFVPGPHQQHSKEIWATLMFIFYWTGLGVASSIGLGFGLHTFVLFLGPFIAQATMTAYECRTLQFETTGDLAFTCPSADVPVVEVSFWGIVHKVQFAAFLWGFGTAIGELPPYFVARAARDAGQRLADLDDINESEPTQMDQLKLRLLDLLKKHGFLGIALFASIPNPLFDLAGLTCGHFGVPFWTFFGATIIGKAVNKATIQSLFVIWMFSEKHVEHVVGYVEDMIPALQGTMMAWIDKQKSKLHSGGVDVHTDGSAGSGSIFGVVWNVFLSGMIFWFIKSIIESTVQERIATEDSITIKRAQSQPLKSPYKYPLLAL